MHYLNHDNFYHDELDNREVMVSIRCLAYNHGRYIRDCLEGFVKQQANFRFEAIVHDDCSTDETTAIIREYAEKYPSLIKPIFEDENQWGKGTIGPIIAQHLRGKYMAWCEGDDYWIDVEKLQRQVDYMESHPECSACWTDGYELYPNGTMKQYGRYLNSGITSLEDVIMQGGMWIPTASLMITREGYENWPPKGSKFHVGDYPLQVHVADIGLVYYFKDPMVVYRVQSQGSWSSRTFVNEEAVEKYYEKELKMLDDLKNYTSDKCHNLLGQLTRLRKFQRAYYRAKHRKNMSTYWQYLGTYYSAPKKYRTKHGVKTLIKMMIRK